MVKLKSRFRPQMAIRSKMEHRPHHKLSIGRTIPDHTVDAHAHDKEQSEPLHARRMFACQRTLLSDNMLTAHGVHGGIDIRKHGSSQKVQDPLHWTMHRGNTKQVEKWSQNTG